MLDPRFTLQPRAKRIIADCLRYLTKSSIPFEKPVQSFSFGSPCPPLLGLDRLSSHQRFLDSEQFHSDICARHAFRTTYPPSLFAYLTGSTNPDAQLVLANCLSDDEICLRAKLNRQLAVRGSVKAAYWLSCDYLTALHSTNEGILWLRIAADGGFPDAMFQYAVFNFEGSLLGSDKQTAYRWFQKASEADHPYALVWSGLMTAAGIGTRKDPAKAVAFLKRAWETGQSKEWREATCNWNELSGLDKRKLLESVLGDGTPKELRDFYCQESKRHKL
jgi:TPR repeat protein